MRIAVPTAQGTLCPHFGHCEQFALVDVDNGKIVKTEYQTPPPHEPGVLPAWLHELGAALPAGHELGQDDPEEPERQGMRAHSR